MPDEPTVDTTPTTETSKVPDGAAAPQENTPDELLRLQRENATLATRLKEAGDVQTKYDALIQQVDDDKKAQLEKQGKYEDLYKTEQTRTEELNARIATMQRWEDFRAAVTKTEKLEYPAATVIELAKHVDTQTGGELGHDDLIAKTLTYIEGLGVIPKPETMALGGGAGSGGRSSISTDETKLRELHKKASEGDPSAKREFIALRAEALKKGPLPEGL
jgi:hypothetical protein